jgi:hypothetical protein
MTDSLPRMNSRRFARWQKAAALAPVLLLLVYLPGEMMLRCRIDGLLRSACCCPQQSERQDSGPVVKAQDCCDREVTQNDRAAAEAAPPAGRDLAVVAPAAFVSAPVPLLSSPTERLDWAWQRYGPAREGPPLVLLKHAFLI